MNVGLLRVTHACCGFLVAVVGAYQVVDIRRLTV